jgi:hypothetical protein
MNPSIIIGSIQKTLYSLLDEASYNTIIWIMSFLFLEEELIGRLICGQRAQHVISPKMIVCFRSGAQQSVQRKT